MTPTPTQIPGFDSDGDGLSDEEEISRGTNPYNADSDGDGAKDGDEVVAGTDPLDRESSPVGYPSLDITEPHNGDVISAY